MIRKIIAPFLIVLLTSIYFGFAAKKGSGSLQSAGTAYALNWKLAVADTLEYKTVMIEIDRPTFEIDFRRFFPGESDSSYAELNAVSDALYQKIEAIESNTNLVARLTNSSNFDEVLDVELIAKPKADVKPSEGDIDGRTYPLMQGTMLRGSVYKTGGIHSFWVKRSQKNLLSLFFELPDHPVEIGDVWPLKNVNLIGNDQNFICEEAERKNEVTLLAVKEVKGEQIAVINYDIMEYAAGVFGAPARVGSKEAEPLELRFVFKAQAEFSLDQGRWISYNGIMCLDGSGWMESSQQQKFALVPQ